MHEDLEIEEAYALFVVSALAFLWLVGICCLVLWHLVFDLLEE